MLRLRLDLGFAGLSFGDLVRFGSGGENGGVELVAMPLHIVHVKVNHASGDRRTHL